MFSERASVGLDVHARSVAAAVIDGVTGEVLQSRLTPSYDDIESWIARLPGPVAVAYEAGPTGFGLYRELTAVGIRCEGDMHLIQPAMDTWTRSLPCEGQLESQLAQGINVDGLPVMLGAFSEYERQDVLFRLTKSVTHREIAERLDYSPVAVSRILRRSLALLRERP